MIERDAGDRAGREQVGAVYAAYCERGESKAIEAIIHSLRGVVSSMDYLTVN